MSRIKHEKDVIGIMIAVYCHRHHGVPSGQLCPECEALLRYARRRLDLCPHGDAKPSCRKCAIHCYSPDKRAMVKTVMRSVGPRMIFIRPITALRHLITELR